VVARSGLAGAMIDLSDGLAIDALRLARASGLAAEIEAQAVPLAPQTRDMARQMALDEAAQPLDWALNGGEDFALLISCPAERADELEGRVAGELKRPLFRVGRLTPGQGLFLVRPGKREALEPRGFDHFSQELK